MLEFFFQFSYFELNKQVKIEISGKPSGNNF